MFCNYLNVRKTPSTSVLSKRTVEASSINYPID